MYYLVYGLLYLFSLLPLWVLYFFSNIAYFFVYYVSGYRKDVVLSNLRIAFPEKTEKERIKIAKQFYLYFTDAMIESLKMISMSKKEIIKRSTGEFDLLNRLIDEGKNIHIMAGHQFNWEFANLLYAMHLKIPFVGVYQVISNKIFDKIFFNFRKKYGTILISAPDFKNKMHTVFTKQYMLALAADQNPGNPANAYWINFLNKPAPFVTGPAKGAVKFNTAVVYVGFQKIKRGHYNFTTTLITENGIDYTPEQLTALYRTELEKTILKDPANYLWSHRRWKYDWKEEYGEVMN
jgi:Kdo2-lipid IVA lauroyltransferase/acyltransferase